MKGFVDYTRYERGFAFAYDLEKKTRYFFYVTSIQGARPAVGQLIEFTPGMTLKGPVALNVRLLDAAETVATLLSAGSKS